MPFSREHFTQAFNALAEPAKRFFLWDAQYVPDTILYHLTLDVLEQGRAVALLIDGGVGRPAYANARAAFEAARDMLVLVSHPDEYCRMGALARAWEVLDIDRLKARRTKADVVLGLDEAIPSESPERTIEPEAALWDTYHAGRGQLLRDALIVIRKQRPGVHWSGLTKAEIGERIASISSDPVGVKEMADVLYGLQSVHAHPGSRTGLRETSKKEDGTLFVEPRPVDLEGPLGFASMAAKLALIALNRRPIPDAKAK